MTDEDRDVVAGPFFSLGAVLLLVGAVRRSSRTALVGAVAIAWELGLPVKLVGVGEGVDDLRPFDAHDFARALVSG